MLSTQVVPSFVQIGQHAWGATGKWLVVASSVVEMVFAIIGMNIIVWKNAALLLPQPPPWRELQLLLPPYVCICV
mgnify:CR=1 FL=1